MYHAFMRYVTVHDADELAELEKQLFPKNCINEHTLAKEIELGSGWVIEQDASGSIVGYMLCRGDDYLLDIMRLGIATHYQGRGFGSELLRHGVKQAEHVMLTVATENTNALRLYHRHGFEIVGRLLGNAGWVMRRTNRTGLDSYFIRLDR